MNFKRLLTTICFVIGLAASVCGADRALVIGIDHYQKVTDTPGSVADADAITALMQRKYKFSRDSIRVLRESEATTENIKNAFRTWLIDGTKPGDRVFFFYSGHGGQVDDNNGDENDELDEVIAPYDIDPGDRDTPPSNFIRDDDINVLLLKLSGRRVVLAFDSCHSGTISRGVEPKSKFVSLNNKYTPLGSTRSMSDRDSYIPKDNESKDMFTAKEGFVDGKLNGVVIFSAAAAYQKAMWLKDRSRGAFAYSFEMSQKDDKDFPSIAELDRRIKDYIENLKVKGLVDTKQTPVMEIISTATIADKPLFGEILDPSGSSSNWEASILPSIYNPLADFKVKLNIDSTTNTFKINDLITYSVEIDGLRRDEKAYLYIVVFSKNDQCRRDHDQCRESCDNEICTKYVVSLFPTPAGGDFDNYVGNGKHLFPRKGAYETRALETGKDIFVALVSKKELLIGKKNEYSWKEAYNLIGVNNLQAQVEALTRSWGNSPKLQGGNWQASSAVVYVR